MIDAHTHVLPGVDDGAPDLEAALAMVRCAVEDGISAMVATPHCRRWEYAGGTSDVARRVADLQSAIVTAGLPLHVYPGGEAYFSPDLVRDVTTGLVPTINNTSYLLVELPVHGQIVKSDDVWFQLRVRGFKIVLAHVERYVHVQEEPRVAFQLAEQGLILQVNAASLLGVAGDGAQNTAEFLLQHDLAHLLASDAHSAVERPPRLRAVAERALMLVGRDRARQLVEDVPRAIVEGKPLALPEPRPVQAKPFWVFWQRMR